MSQRNASTSMTSLPAAAATREPVSTKHHTTRRRLRHGWLAALAASLAAATGACGGGGGSRTDSYTKATSEQEACCEHLEGPARDECLGQIVRVDDPSVAKTDANQDTYRCIEQNFTCDPSSGHATQESAQAQYDCIAELGQ